MISFKMADMLLCFSVPEMVLLLAPCNNLSTSRTVTEAAAEFGRLLAYVCSRWPRVTLFIF